MHEQNRKVLEIIEAMGFRYNSEFAALLEISEADLSRYVTGKRIPSKTFVEKLFAVCSVSPDWFYRNEGDMFVRPTDEVSYDSNNVEWLRDELLRAKDDVIRVTEELVAAKEETNRLLQQVVELMNR